MPFDNQGRFDKHTFGEAEKTRLLALPGYVILGKRPGGNRLSAVIELSFAMDKSEERVLFWVVRPDMKEANVFRDCERYRKMFSKDDYEFKIWSVRDPDLPIEINWEEWLWANSLDDRRLLGVRSKYRARNPEFRARNPEFKMKELAEAILNHQKL